MQRKPLTKTAENMTKAEKFQVSIEKKIVINFWVKPNLIHVDIIKHYK